jgi:hypothetical protein
MPQNLEKLGETGLDIRKGLERFGSLAPEKDRAGVWLSKAVEEMLTTPEARSRKSGY